MLLDSHHSAASMARSELLMVTNSDVIRFIDFQQIVEHIGCNILDLLGVDFL